MISVESHLHLQALDLLQEKRVDRLYVVLHDPPRQVHVAGRAGHPVVPTVQLDDVAGPCCVVQSTEGKGREWGMRGREDGKAEEDNEGKVRKIRTDERKQGVNKNQGRVK